MPTHIIIDDISPLISYTVGGSPRSTFPVPYAFFEDTDLVVTAGAEVLDSGDYTVTGTVVDAGFSSGTVELIDAVTDVVVTIERILPIERTVDFPDSGPLSIRALNTQLDKIAAWCQQLQGATTALAQRLTDWIALISTSITSDIVTVNVATRAAAELASFSDLTLYIRTAGYRDVGDGGGALYKSVVSGGDFDSADGKHWQIAENIVTPYMLGAYGDGTHADEAAFALAFAIVDEITVPAGTYRISTNTTWAKGKKLTLLQGAVITVDSAVTLTINGLFYAGFKRCFAGAGTVVGLRHVRYEWFGALGRLFGSSTTSLTVGVGSRQFTVAAGLPIAVDSRVRAFSASVPNKWVEGKVTAYAGTLLTILSDAVGAGTGTVTDWTIEANDYTAIAAAHACLQSDSTISSDGFALTAELGRVNYMIGQTVTFAPSLYAQLFVKGAGIGSGGSRFLTLPDFAGANAVTIATQLDGQRLLMGFELKDFGIENYTSGVATRGLFIGGVTGGLASLYGQNLIENVHCVGFQFGIVLQNCRSIDFLRCSVDISGKTNSYGLLVGPASGTSTGEMTFTHFVVNADPADTSTGVGLINATSNGGINGFCFERCIIYHATTGFHIESNGGAGVGDIWIGPGTQIDGVGGTAISVLATGAGSGIEDVRVQGIYLRGMTVAGITITSATSGRVANCAVTNCAIMNVTGPSVLVNVANGVRICDNEFFDPNPGVGNPAARFLGTGGCRFDGNTIVAQVGSTAVAAYMVQWDLGNDRFHCCDNNGNAFTTTGVVNDLAGAITKTVTGNI